MVLIQADRKQSASRIPERPELPCGRLSFQCRSQMKCGKWKDNVTVSIG